MTTPAVRSTEGSNWLTRAYRRLIGPSEFIVKFHYGRPWETERVPPSRGA